MMQERKISWAMIPKLADGRQTVVENQFPACPGSGLMYSPLESMLYIVRLKTDIA